MTTRLRKFLRSVDAADYAVLHDLLRSSLQDWRAEGWALTGRPPQLRLTIIVRKKVREPRRRAHSIELPRSLGGGRLKLAVHAMHRERAVRPGLALDAGDRAGVNLPAVESAAMPSGAGTDYLAPGAPVACDGARIGIGAVVSISGTPHIVTCGHAVDADTLTTVDGGTEIATLRNNFSVTGDRLDAAVFTVSADGLSLLEQGSLAPSWCTTFHTPADADNDTDVTFWPTAGDHQPSFVEKVISYSACIPSSIGCGYVMLTRCTSPGDSGSSLQIGNSYYALASRRDGNNSFFTPIRTIVDRLQSGGAQVSPWSPQ